MRKLGLIAALLAGLTTGAEARNIQVVASFSVLGDVVAQVGGTHVSVRSLVPPGGDPHGFEPSPDDARLLKAADLTFISGEGLENWFDRLARASGAHAQPVVVSAAVKPLTMVDDGKTITDPHVWNDPANVILWVAAIERALAAADPEDAGDFAASATAYVAKLRAVDADARARIGAIAPQNRKVLTSHDSLGYFGHAYGVTFLAPIGYSTDAQPSAATIARLIAQIRREGIHVYFLENSGDARLVKQIAAATGAQPGGTLYVESLSPREGPAADYLAMFRSNVDTLVAAMAR